MKLTSGENILKEEANLALSKVTKSDLILLKSMGNPPEPAIHISFLIVSLFSSSRPGL